MNEAVADSTEVALMELTPIAGGTERWTVALDADILELRAPGGRTVMMLPREEAARNIRFAWEVFRGRSVSFSLAEGMRGHRFRCGRAELRGLIDWLPRRDQAARERELRLHGVALILAGAVQLLLHAYFFAGWGLAMVLAGLANMLYPHRLMFLLDGLALFGIGLIMLFAPQPVAYGEVNPEAARLMSTVLGAALLVWAVQHWSLLGTNHQLHAARTHGREMAGDAPRSRVVRWVAWAALALAALMAAHVAGIYWAARGEEAIAAADEVILYLAPMLVLLASAGALLLRRRAPYLEAQLTGQFVLVLGVLYGLGLSACLAGGESPWPAGALRAGAALAVRLYVWAPIVLLVLGFNRFYSRAAWKEAEAALE